MNRIYISKDTKKVVKIESDSGGVVTEDVENIDCEIIDWKEAINLGDDDPRTEEDKFLVLKKIKLEEVHDEFSDLCDNGVLINGILLRTNASDRYEFSALVGGLKELLDSGLANNDTTVTIYDANHQPYEISVENLIGSSGSIMPQYTLVCMQQMSRLSSITKSIEAATTIEEVDNISVE